jgi:hypothetical protein
MQWGGFGFDGAWEKEQNYRHEQQRPVRFFMAGSPDRAALLRFTTLLAITTLCMFGLFKKKPEAPAKPGYRAFPEMFPHPARARRFTAEEFAAKQKQKMQAAPSVCAGHESTTIWYVAGTPAERFYIVEIRFSAHPPVYIQSICTFTPTMGMDRVDGELAQDAEEIVMQEVLGRQTRRLEAFPPSADIPSTPYLRNRGFAK